MNLEKMADNARLALDTILQRPAKGIPSWLINVMEHACIERLAGTAPGSYRRDPETVYLAMQCAVGTCLLDQYIPDNPLTMGDRGYEGSARGATTGAARIVVDGSSGIVRADLVAGARYRLTGIVGQREVVTDV